MSDGKKQLLKIFIEVFPLVMFLYTYDAKNWESVYLATGVFMGAMLVSMVASKLVFKKIGLILWISGFFVGVLGGLTLYFRDPMFIKMKPTIFNGLLAITLLGGVYFKKYFLKNVFEAGFPPMPDEIWKKLSFRFGLFYIFNAGLNEVIHRNFSFETWLETKIWIGVPLGILFMMAQMPMLMKYMEVEEKSSEN
ncbi:hypothetical protein MNBD_ALPHA03-1814 [hydrothermal vent metagenome]|uniref:Intracellular septation protein IspA n=1 Tax=hydrothermal vent metagenome TaxID=652676 RepID=A0A3B1AWG8_9ZZZZ